MNSEYGFDKIINIIFYTVLIYLVVFLCLYLFRLADNITNLYLTVINTFLLYFGCTKSFDFVFKKISFKKEKETNE